ncbi:Regulatory protein PchR [uncultured bacterium]|nr:Regulatory protein PchR [uncultured bacterium]
MNNHWCVKNEDLPIEILAQSVHQLLPQELGTGYSNIMQLDAGLSYIETDFVPNKDFSILSQIETQEPRMVLTLGLQGQSGFTNHRGSELSFNAGYTTIATFGSSIGERQYQAHNAVKQLRVSVSQAWVERYFPEEQAEKFFKQHLQQLSHRPISAQGRIVIQQLHNTQVLPELKRVFVHGQVMNLLVSELNNLYQEEIKFNQRDKNIAMLARDILMEEYQNPPSVEQLARRAGTNTFKLKQLFKHFFDNTPYGMLLDIRMNKAYQLLSAKHYHVNTVADLVGYGHASNFSVAFNKYYGVTPKKLSKQ